jgi:UDP-N-acetylmuramoyl-L-alanyl-D-glutamate--2,6-diaminopimelate ligase
MKKFLKKILPARLIVWYHCFLALVATVYYGFPAKKMMVIGVTGTKGKTSTANFIWSVLMAGGHRTGIISTANIRIGEKEFLNPRHMTMPGRFVIQKLMAEMVKNGCQYCVVETTSEGLKQHRQVGIYYNIGVFTNLSPEHLPSHGGSFEKYKKMKGKMFAGGLKVIVANKDDENSDYYLSFPADKKITFALEQPADYVARDIQETTTGVNFDVDKIMFQLAILGKFNVYNALPAVIIGRLVGMDSQTIAKGLLALKVIPGRMELINEGQKFTVIVDYAHEQKSMTSLLQTANNLKGLGAKIILSLGDGGGGRDRAKRPVMGELAAKLADYVIVSDTDPYDDDPQEIIETIGAAAEKFGKIRNENLFLIADRRVGIRRALNLAKAGDLVLITGKGAEQSMMMANDQSIPWDDRIIVREELKKILS